MNTSNNQSSPGAVECRHVNEVASTSPANPRPWPGTIRPRFAPNLRERQDGPAISHAAWSGHARPRSPHYLLYSPLQVLVVDRAGKARAAGVLALACDTGRVLAWEIVVGLASTSMPNTLADLLAAMPRAQLPVRDLVIDPQLDFLEVKRTADRLGILARRSSARPIGNDLHLVTEVAKRLLAAEARPAESAIADPMRREHSAPRSGREVRS